ncbi:uncharacterized protein LOC131996095 [Stomoxys calcitrans]|uniref:uncharacterized protein LOC131996095 n=1 Tax=Stomoxys calcitrans TaxID=35570 RepID=UPI0027E33274|nr:uncharacterized protein LOC131996095 [Stomoxys calcitrans]
MYRNKRQPAHKTHGDNLVLGPRRRRRDLAPHVGKANVDENAAAAGLDGLDEDDSYEVPIMPSKPQGPTKNDEDNAILEDRLDEHKLLPPVAQNKPGEESKSQPKVEETIPQEKQQINSVPTP